MSDPVVSFDEIPVGGGALIGRACLNSPRTLNALSLDMIQHLEATLENWATDDRVVAVWLEGSGDKAFCAGGDVVALYRSLNNEGGAASAGYDGTFAEAYFTAEYRLDYRLHTFPKPLLVWGDGIVMGGGLGLLAGGYQRIVTETTRIAMPEITIGLYPDVGASWFLHKMPEGVGAYLGLTGAQLNGRDALDLGMADRFVPRDSRDALIAALSEADYGDRSSSSRRAAVQAVLDRFENRAEAPAAQVWPHLDHIQALVGRDDPAAAVARILADTCDDEWLAANRKRLAKGCPMTAHLVWRMLERLRHSSLADAFRDELVLSVQCCKLGDVAEGVRALLIEKDMSPNWQHSTVASVPEADIQALLTPPWAQGKNPLADLGQPA
ncbi:enoyl-CoA hydratase/isomerase family protein [Halomonas halocynthiae]|uniref:enoyl-CoA hydratase/isomerase family protein n=1 Tax=Halomonas halocynthiae TaxID=176290 RepID=UPI0003F82132|nr:enoyl-CoA hydratase/isomerase family protein [Halomonas halocynthiae]